MSEPIVPKSLNGVLSELVSAQSALNMEPTPIENAEGPYSSDKDFWVNHAYAHINAAFKGVDGLRELEASHERLRVALEYAAYELDVAYCGIKTLPDDHPARLVVNKADAALSAIPEAK